MVCSFRLFLLSTAALGAWGQAASAQDAAPDEGDTSRSDIIVTGVMDRQTASATGLPLSLRETPQSITVVDRDRIQDFALTNVNDLLTQTVGINVERVETDRTYYNSRGFDITNFQVDGIGLPLLWGIQFGDLDTALFERVEAIRGANAIMTGVGNPSATINYVRKRPTRELQANATALVGSWGQKRVEADISGPLTRSGNVSARLIFAHEDRDSYLDYNQVTRNVFGALLAWELTPGLTATVGYSRQENDADGVLWGALPLLYSNGQRIPYPVSASTSADWTYWNVTDQSAFGELAYALGGGWQVKGVVTYKRFVEHAKLLYGYGYPDADTGLGVGGMSGIYPSFYNQYLGDFYASGPFKLFGREHQLAFGVSTARSEGQEYENFSEEYPSYPDVRLWGTEQIAEPSYPGEYLAADYTDRLTRVYGAAHLNLTDQLKAVVGASAMWLKSTGYSYGQDQGRKASRVSPYLGAVYDITPNISVYASYTDIFLPQLEVDVTNRKLDPAQGSSIEGGIKSQWLDGRLYVTASLFRAKQKNLASAVGTFGEDGPGRAGDTYYEGVDTTSRGFEIEVAGNLTDNWTVSGGYTGLEIEDEAGEPTRIFLPTKSFKFATTYTLPDLNDLKLGAQLRWQNAIHYLDSDVQAYMLVDGDVLVTQKAYAVLDLMASVRLVDHLRASVNVRNVTDKKYLGSLMWGQAYYAAPRSAMFSLSFDY